MAQRRVVPLVAAWGALTLAGGCLLDRSGVLGIGDDGDGGAAPTTSTTTAGEGGFSVTTSASGGAATTSTITTASGGGEGGATPSGGGGHGGAATGGGGTSCPGPVAPVPTVCPPQCTAGSDCDNGICIIDCNGTQKCKAGDMPTCPPGYHCTVDCLGTQACEDAVVNCPTGTSCAVICGTGTQTCKNLQVQCDALAPCSLSCADGNACELTSLNCQLGSCTAKCGAGTNPKPNVACGSACACESC